MKYPDLRSGGAALAAALQEYKRAPDTIVLGIVRGGVTLAHEVARTLELPLDLVLLRTMMLRPPATPICAARVAGTLVLDDELTAMTAQSSQAVEDIFIADALQAFARREEVCRGVRSPARIAGRTVLLVDNGLRTGGTMRLAINAVRRLNPARIVSAVPAGPPAAIALVTPLADEVICLRSPEPFGHVGMCYERFEVGSESDIGALLDSFVSDTTTQS